IAAKPKHKLLAAFTEPRFSNPSRTTPTGTRFITLLSGPQKHFLSRPESRGPTPNNSPSDAWRTRLRAFDNAVYLNLEFTSSAARVAFRRLWMGRRPNPFAGLLPLGRRPRHCGTGPGGGLHKGHPGQRSQSYYKLFLLNAASCA